MYKAGFVKQDSTIVEEDSMVHRKEKDPKKSLPQAVSLEKKKQNKFAKKVNKLRNDMESGNVKLEDQLAPKPAMKPYSRGLVYLAHIPHGFYEAEMREYFKQFGQITNVMICRSKRTGKSRGMGYVEFQNQEVAKIAAETMNNYLMFKRRLIANYIPPESVTPLIFQTKVSKTSPPCLKARRKANNLKNKNISTDKYVKDAKIKLKTMGKKFKALQALGIAYTLDPVNVPNTIERNKEAAKIKIPKEKGAQKKIMKLESKEAQSPSKIGKKSKKEPSINAKVDLMKLAAKEMLKTGNRVITTRSGMKKLRNKK